MTALVTDNDERAEAEVFAALDDLGHAVDGNDCVLQLQLRWIDTLIDQL
jgi:hypothetical protein